ncbi:MAG TPA: outer membrane lipoprotein carrier protein LolA [Aestuariivirgaceae bacterium]|nr:outer membrane lipoprotein carrier protein LolA [Aestuariivirgaceae bacterium]
MNRGLKLAMTGLALLAIGSLGALDRTAVAARADALNGEQRAAIEQITGYFNAMRTLQGEFMQVGPKGHVSTGVFYIAKPGRLRFEYAPPNPFIVVADGTWVTIKNNAKNTADQYPLSATPLRLVLAEQVNLLSEAKILDVEQVDGLTTLTLEDKEKLVPGHLVLIFDDHKNELQQWIIVDGQGRRTTISLNDIVAGVDPDPKLFQVELPERKAPTSR